MSVSLLPDAVGVQRPAASPLLHPWGALVCTLAFGIGGGPGWAADSASDPGSGRRQVESIQPADRKVNPAGAAPAATPPNLKTPAPDPGVLPPAANSAKLNFIDTHFENASPLWYDFGADGTIRLHLLYDHERSSPNRAAGHLHFRVHAIPGSRLTLEFVNLDNVWNGQPGSVARELKTLVVSENGRDWRPVPTRAVPTHRIQLDLEMPGPQLSVARVEPYRLSDLNRWLDSIRAHPLVEITTIGHTVEGRELEIVRLGPASAPRRVFLRARAHPWETAGNWVMEGLTERLLRGDPPAERFLQRYGVDLLPMANKDGVAHGMTRFNVSGKDLNRNWDQPADPQLAPENAALERWLERMIASGRGPDLALDLHNDGGGQLHISRPAVPGLDRYLARMARLEALLREHTWFTEGRTQATFRNPGSLGDGWLERFGVDAAVHEFHCNWIAALADYPSAKHWRQYGAQLATVLSEYFNVSEPDPGGDRRGSPPPDAAP